MRLPDGHANLFPYMMVEGAESLLQFLVDAFDATVVGKTYQDARLANARVRIGEVTFMASEAGAMLGAMPGAYYLFVDDVDATHSKALDCGAEEIFSPTDMAYGDRQSGVRDPTGNVWFPSTRLVDGPYQD